jgi:hypothetical protein
MRSAHAFVRPGAESDHRHADFQGKLNDESITCSAYESIPGTPNLSSAHSWHRPPRSGQAPLWVPHDFLVCEDANREKFVAAIVEDPLARRALRGTARFGEVLCGYS